MLTVSLLSEKLVKVCVCLMGMVVFLFIKLVMTPPAISISRDRGATSRRRRSKTASEVPPTSGEDSGLNSSSIGNSLVGVDGLVQLLSIWSLWDSG